MLTSTGYSVNPDVFITIVPAFAILGSTSNFSVSAFQSSPTPASEGYPPVAPEIASSIAPSTYNCVASKDVSSIPWTFVVAELCVAIAAFLLTTSAASASTRF